MSLQELENVIGNTPIDRQSGKRLVHLVERAKAEGHKDYTFDLLIQEVNPQSPEALALAMHALVQNGIVQRVIRVESPTTHGGIGDFSSVAEVPKEIHDWRADEDIQVRPENLHVVYKF